MKKKPNLLLIGIDSLRRDRMSLYGYPRLTTPHMDKYLKGGTVFNQCFSASIPTTSGYACMLTGRDCFGTDVVALGHKGEMAPGVPTLAEVLRDEGYNTTCVGFQQNPAGRGFDNYLDFSGWGCYADGRSPKAENLNAVTLPEMKRLADDDKPFFLFLRHMDPHSPYLPPAPFERMFYGGDEYDTDNKSLDAAYKFKPFCDFFYSWFPPGCTDVEYLKAQYDGEVAYMDASIQALLQQLETLGIDDDTLVVITSDHGETLDEHDCYFDHHGLYECTLSVPLAFRYNGKVPSGLRFDDICQLKDVMPTILDIMGVRAKGVKFDGKSLYGRMNGEERPQETEFYVTECTWMRKHGWRTPQYKLIRAMEPDFHNKVPVELYDLVADPAESRNIADSEPEIVAALTRRMEAFIKKREKETKRPNPMTTNGHWNGLNRPFENWEEAYNHQHIGDVEAARKLQASLEKKTKKGKA